VKAHFFASVKGALLLGLVSCLVPAARGFDPGATDITAISSRAAEEYVRARQADGSYAPESYVFGKGGLWAGAMEDPTMDKLAFLDIAHMIALPLASQNYLPSKDPKTTRLLIMVYWGTTRAPEHATESNGYVNLQAANGALSSATMQAQGMSKAGAAAVTSAADSQLSQALMMVQAENKQRERDDVANIRMLGYDSWLEKTQADMRGTALEQNRRDLYDEVEQNRYFVVLMAYDFQLAWKQKKHQFLWETRFSMRQMHHDFARDLPSMAQYASKFFGQDSHGLIHETIPLGRVDIGEVKSLGEVPAK
jgi:hypothetical protein